MNDDPKWRPGILAARILPGRWRDVLEAPVEGWVSRLGPDGEPCWGQFRQRLDMSIRQADLLAGWMAAHGDERNMLMVMWAQNLRLFDLASWGKLKRNHPWELSRVAAFSERPFCREPDLGSFLASNKTLDFYRKRGWTE